MPQIPGVSKGQHKSLTRYAIHIYTIHAPLVYRNIHSFYVATYVHWIYFRLHLQSSTIKECDALRNNEVSVKQRYVRLHPMWVLKSSP